MADAVQKPEVIVSMDRCCEVTDELSRHDVIAVDCEGDNLSATGPLTLLQISTQTHTVYFFDILSNREMLKTGSGLKELLESGTVTKVFHACEHDSTALYHQFGITLNNVFDTQVAHAVLEEEKGILFAKRAKLTFISETYGSRKEVDKTVKRNWWYVCDYWGQRPLTEEMINYASDDVTALLPKVYTEQKRLLSQHCAEGRFAERVQENIKKCFDARYEKNAKVRLHKNMATWMVQLREIRGRGSLQAAVTKLSDDHIRGFWLCRSDEIYPFSIPQWIIELRNEQMFQQLTQMNDKIELFGLKTIDTDEFLTPQLRFMACKLNTERVRNLASDILNKVRLEELRRVNVNYASGQPLTTFEKMAVVGYNQRVTPSYYADLVKNVIRDVEREISSRVDCVSGTDMKIKKLAEFHKRFLKIAPIRYLSSDVVQLKRALMT